MLKKAVNVSIENNNKKKKANMLHIKKKKKTHGNFLGVQLSDFSFQAILFKNHT